jgi:NRAMP (natural resistance-associated macrophage protein)-like metal ion transporter
MKNFRKWFQKIGIFLAIMGPGVVTAFADNDAAGVATYSVAASKYGYQILITLIPITVVLAVTQEIGARLSIVSGKGLADMIRERYGVFVSLVMFFLVFFVNFAVILQDVSGLKSALELFGYNYRIYLPLVLGVLFFFLVKASYRHTERLLFIVMISYITYFASAIMAKPDWGLVAKSILIPQGKISFDFAYTSIAVLGTTVTAWGQFVIGSSIRDKKLSPEDLKYEQLEVIVGSVLTDVFTLFMMVAVASTLFVNKIPITGAAEASLAIRPFAGDLSGILFGIGLFAAGFMGCTIVPMSTAYIFSELFGFEGSLDHGFKKSRFFYGFIFFQLILALVFVIQPGFSLFQITLWANFFNGIMLPVIFYFLYSFANNVDIMGKYKNSWSQNLLLIGTSIAITIGALASAVGMFFNL